jgi:hypothetical protein
MRHKSDNAEIDDDLEWVDLDEEVNHLETKLNLSDVNQSGIVSSKSTNSQNSIFVVY